MKKQVSIPKGLKDKITKGLKTPISVIVQYHNISRTSRLEVSSFTEINNEIDKLTKDLPPSFSVNIGF